MEVPEKDGEFHCHIVAGQLVRCSRQLPGLPTSGFHDGEVLVRVVEQPTVRAGDWLSAPIVAPVTIHLRTDGCELEAAAAEVSSEDLAVAVRSAVPFAAALQAKVTLHAAGVATKSGSTAILGASGAGKSTLAAALKDLGLAVVADDLLPCRSKAGRIMTPSCPNRCGDCNLAPLAGVFFLCRVPELDQPSLKRLGKRDCFQLLVRHGFGEMAEANAWSAQVDLYHCIVEQVPAFEMTIPDDLARVAEMARWFETACRRELR